MERQFLEICYFFSYKNKLIWLISVRRFSKILYKKLWAQVFFFHILTHTKNFLTLNCDPSSDFQYLNYLMIYFFLYFPLFHIFNENPINSHQTKKISKKYYKTVKNDKLFDLFFSLRMDLSLGFKIERIKYSRKRITSFVIRTQNLKKA